MKLKKKWAYNIMNRIKSQKNIPMGWEVKKLGSMFTVRRGGSPRPIEQYITNKEDGLNWLKIGDIDVGAKYINKTSSKILKEGLSRTTLVKAGDFILSNSMSFGRPYIMNIDSCIHDGWLTFQNIDAKILNRDFLYYLLSHSKTQSLFQSISAGSGVQNLKKETVSEVALPIPPVSEQRNIVSVLETWDQSIEKLTKKIKVKKEIKKGLMHDLLTGKVRLAGFSDKWETHELGELLDYEQPTPYIVKTTDYDDAHKIPVLTANKAFILGYTNETNGIYEKHPVIIFDDFTTDNKFVDFEFKVKSSAIKILSAKNKNINLRFVFGKMQLINFVVGQHKRHYLSEYQYVTLDMPKIEEQNAIEKILTTADEEIKMLEKKLAVLKDQKKYLLNNLITGTIRTKE